LGSRALQRKEILIDLRLQFAAKNWQSSGSTTATGYGLYYVGSSASRVDELDPSRRWIRETSSSFVSQDRRLEDGEFAVALRQAL